MTPKIDGVGIWPLQRFEDPRGRLLRMLRSDDDHFEGFGEIYFSQVYPGAVKAWRRHRRVTSFLAVPFGRLRLVLADDRPSSSSLGCVFELELGVDNYCLVKIPPLIWSGWQGLSDGPALLANCATEPHDPDEVDRRDPDNPPISYVWR